MMRYIRALIIAVLLVGAVTAAHSRAVPENTGSAQGTTRPGTGTIPLDSASPLLVLVPATVSSVPILALEARFPRDYRVEFFTDHPQAMARLIQGEADILATGFALGFTRHRNAGDMIHLATPVWGVSAIMTHRPVASLGELAGAEIYAPFEGSPIDVFLRAMLAAEGLADTVTIRYAPFPQAAALVAQGNAAAAVLVEPIASRLEIAGNAHRLENLHERWARVTGGEPRSPQVSVFAHRRHSESRGERHDQLVERLADIVADMQRDPVPFAREFSTALDVPPAVVLRALDNTLFSMPGYRETVALITSYTRVMGDEEPDTRFFRRGE